MLPCSVTASEGMLQVLGLLDQFLDAARAVEQRELRVQVQVNELGHGLGVSLSGLRPRRIRPYSHSIVDGGFELMS